MPEFLTIGKASLLTRWLFALSLVFCVVAFSARDACAQEFARYLSDPEGRLAAENEPFRAPAISMEAVADALRAAEDRLAALEAERLNLSQAQDETDQRIAELFDDKQSVANKKADAEKNKKWYEKYNFRGYAQFRINEVLDREVGSAPAQHAGDSSVGDNQTFLIRRARIVISGDINDHISLYLQPDFASTPNGSTDAYHFTQIRDWYADVHLDKDRIYRIRVGQSKVPYGWENLQSSQNRLPLDRNDAFNSGTKNERDLGAFFYWTPEYAQDLFRFVLDEGLKGSGNYGVFGFGFYSGQGGSLREQNDDLHVISRLTLPYRWANGQVTEVGIQGYSGMYTVLSSAISPLGIGPAVRPAGTLEQGNREGIIDNRLGATLVYYPQPLGFQAEWTVGRGPSLNDAQTEVTDRPLYGGYLMSMYRQETNGFGELIPFVRWAYFKGGYKSERNAPFSEIDELELGLEWQFSKYLELVGMYTLTDRTNTRAISAPDALSYRQFEGSLARFQLQVNY